MTVIIGSYPEPLMNSSLVTELGTDLGQMVSTLIKGCTTKGFLPGNPQLSEIHSQLDHRGHLCCTLGK